MKMSGIEDGSSFRGTRMFGIVGEIFKLEGFRTQFINNTKKLNCVTESCIANNTCRFKSNF